MMEPPIAKDRLTLDTATQMPQDRARSAATTTTVSLEPAAACACPRCDSEETKFCYFNNYNRAQPRYFCKVRFGRLTRGWGSGEDMLPAGEASPDAPPARVRSTLWTVRRGWTVGWGKATR